jgi:hypothetical protein
MHSMQAIFTALKEQALQQAEQARTIKEQKEELEVIKEKDQ